MPVRASASFRIIPAYAGSTGARRSSSTPTSDHPRIRGEHPGSLANSAGSSGSSPHTRGALSRNCESPSASGIIPAYAGSTRRSEISSCSRRDHPRIRGEHPIAAKPDNLVMGSSPHTRGARSAPIGFRSTLGIIPAYAGSTWRVSGRALGYRDHPRIRGEHHMSVGHLPSTTGSSPHTRGARGELVGRADDGGIIPAYAGSTPPTACRRGKTSGIIPAYAGSTVPMALMATALADHPRIRGEHDTPLTNVTPFTGSSPHTRGALGFGIARRRRPRIIPAYAGSTSQATRASGAGKDHPRIRGEHSATLYEVSVVAGSSPHTRGAPPGPSASARPRRIIPAYAGSTTNPWITA